jgi:hypothetical protein
VGVAEGVGRLSDVGVLVEGTVSAAGPGYASGLVPVALGAGSSRVAVAGEEGVGVPGLGELVLDGIAVGGRSDLLIDSPRLLVERIHPIPRIETTPMAIGIKSARSNEGRGCIPD